MIPPNNLIKTELHIHIEGTLEPKMYFEKAKKHQVSIPYDNIQDLEKSYQFTQLSDFLNLYNQATQVLRDPEDFFDLTWAYLQKMKQQNVIHTEIFFDPQLHIQNGVPLNYVIDGISSALAEGTKKLGISCQLIMCFLRDLGLEQATQMWKKAKPFLKHISAIGLDSTEKGYPPGVFAPIFQQAQAEGLHLVAHAGEEGPVEYIWEALKQLKVERIDHGFHAVEDWKLLQYLAEKQIPLTLCPLSNRCLKVCPDLTLYPLRKFLENQVIVCLNSDDPAYFGGYISENYQALIQALYLNEEQVQQLQKYSVLASFMTDQSKQLWLKKIQEQWEHI